jgi:hypothetical protein
MSSPIEVREGEQGRVDAIEAAKRESVRRLADSLHEKLRYTAPEAMLEKLEDYCGATP